MIFYSMTPFDRRQGDYGKNTDHRDGLPLRAMQSRMDSEQRTGTVACPKCKSPYWNRPRKASSMLTYEDFRDKIRDTCRS